MRHTTSKLILTFVILCLALGNAPAFAKHDGGSHGREGGDNPPGWSHGEKKGWDGKDMPPGLFKKDEKAQNDKKDGKKEKSKDRKHKKGKNR